MMNGDHNDRIDPVRSEDACPNCGERECDELLWLDDCRVQCQSCDKVYEPGAKDPPA